MSGFGFMLSSEVEKSVLSEAQELAACDLQSLLQEQAEAVQHILAVSCALARRAEAQGRLLEKTTPASGSNEDAKKSPRKNPSNGQDGWGRNFLEPLLAREDSPEQAVQPPAQAQMSLASRAMSKLWDRQPAKQDTLPKLRNDEGSGDEKDKKRSARRKLFPDVTSMQEFLRSCLRKDIYRVEDYYKTEGCFQAIARSAWFRNATFVVILLNTLWIGYDTDNNKAEVICNAEIQFKIAENFFCCFFTAEVLIRLMSFKRKRDALSDGWFVFDATLVSFMVWETWVSAIIYILMDGAESSGGGAASILRIFRLFRLTRVARLGRLISAVPELMLLVNSIAMAVRSVGSTLGLMFVIIYVYAILFTQLLRDTEVGKDRFETVPMSINFLLLGSVFPDQKDDINDMLEEHWIFYLCFCMYLLLGSITVMNMLIGVLCKVVDIAAEAEQREGQENRLKGQLMEILNLVDENHDQLVDPMEMQKIVENPEAVILLNEVGVDVYALVANMEFIFHGKSELKMDDFFNEILRFRDSNMATQKDLVDLQKHFTVQAESIVGKLKAIIQPEAAA